MKNILVLGGDGYCGWSTALHLSDRGFRVGIVDNFLRRLWDHELSSPTLTPIATLPERIREWKRVSGKTIEPYIGDITNWSFISSVIAEFKPDDIVHFDDMRYAAYS